ncbi:MAG: hypothetical protein M3092_02185 [Actinomycetia bacterium]|nr:hypothetical protein [Actinomycetes bacterium]
MVQSILQLGHALKGDHSITNSATRGSHLPTSDAMGGRSRFLRGSAKYVVSYRSRASASLRQWRIVVFLNPPQGGVNTTARDDPIDKPIRGVIDVSLSESTPQQIVPVVRQLEIVSHMCSGHAPSSVQIRVDNHHLLRSQKGP